MVNFAPHGAKEGKPTEMGFSLKDTQSNLRLPLEGDSSSDGEMSAQQTKGAGRAPVAERLRESAYP